MKDISPKKTASAKDSSLGDKKTSRASEIEEIYRGNNVGYKTTKASTDDWSRAVARRPMRKKWLWLGGSVVVAVAFVMFLVGAVFGKATLIITPKQGDLILSGVEDANKRSLASSTASVLTYDTISKVEDSEKRIVKASGEEKVEKKAEGKIVVYNKNTVTQKLVANTRFQATNGKIYRLVSAVTIPAGKKSGSTVNPGSVEVVVLADKVGPGFAGSAKFKTIYGRSKTEMTGGFSGLVRKISQADLDKNRTELQKLLRDRLIKKAGQDVPVGYVLFSDAVKIKYEDRVVNDPSLPADKAYVSVQASLSGIIFKRDELSMYFAQKLIPNYDGSPVEIDNFNKLEFALQNKDILDLEKTTKISFSLDGTGHVVWLFDQAKLKKGLLGKSRAEAEKVWPEFTAIERVKTVFFPPWLWTFPKKETRIVIEIDGGVK